MHLEVYEKSVKWQQTGINLETISETEAAENEINVRHT